MKSKSDKQWNRNVASNIRKLKPVKDWLEQWIDNKGTDWASQKSAHQALKLLEMAEYEMWNMGWMSKKEQALYMKTVKTVI